MPRPSYYRQRSTYPQGKYGLVKNAKNYKVLKIKDATEEYLLYSQKYFKIMKENKYEILKNLIKTLPVDLVNAPYNLHKFHL